jgi:hypothetical protein
MRIIKSFNEYLLEGVDLDRAKEQEIQAKIKENMDKLNKQLAVSEDSKKTNKEKAAFKARVTQSMAKLHTDLGKSKARESQLISKEAKAL